MSNVSVILCVPCLIKDNCYSIIDIVTEPMQCKISTSMLVKNTNKIGAFKRVDVKNESQRLSVKMIDNNIYNVELVDSIQRNQMNGDTPNYCIPLMINAITVQGISYSDPYFSSFNLNYKEMALGAPVYMNKSDYAFKSSLCIRQDEPCTSKVQQLYEKSAKDMLCETNKSRMNDCDKSKRKDHDNNVSRSYGAGVDLSYDAMLEIVKNEGRVLKAIAAVEPVDSWGKPRRLRLCGGGETSLNAATGWGTPPASTNNTGNWGGNPSGQSNNATNNTQPQWNNTAQRPPTSQAENAIIPGNGANSPNSTNGPNPGNGGNGTSTASSAKIEQLNSMREALFSQDGWGGQHVNQDTNWDVPGSPEPGSKVEPGPAGGPPAWKPNVNNGAFLGTDLWEANLRNGGAPPPPAAAKTPWGHTPTTNIGGTWGEDDDADQGNVWNGPPPAAWSGPAPPPPQWTPHKKDDWNAWGEPPRPEMHYEPPRPPADPRHDLRGGISGRLNGDMWHHPPKAAPPPAAWPHRDEPSPPARRANPPYDDGTSLWGQRATRPPPHRLPPPASKPGDVWGQPPAAPRTWEDPHAGPWPDRDQHWPDAAQGLWPNSKPKPPAGPGGPWPEDIGEWGGPKPAGAAPSLGKQIPKEMIWNSKQFRYLIELGYKKEEAEAALRSRDMNVEEAVELLTAARGEPWRREEFSFAPPAVNKLLAPPNQFGTSAPPPQSQPSTQQLRMLVQQIQMAVTAGYLNHQILNQPLAPQTLVLLNQLLQQIKVLQQLVQQHSLAISKANSTVALQCSVQITKAKQQITALQNQIATQQALYMKQQPGNTGGGDLFKQNPDPLAQLQNNFTDMSIAKDSQPGYGASGNQQSRLNKWKLPSLDKDDESSEFSRAPGTAKSTTSPQLNQLGLQHDSTWALGRGEGWGEGGDVADGKEWPSHAPVYDLVPEFEPGKPWKGNQMKNVEDDPAMTPGSVGRSPLSLPLKEGGVGGAGGAVSPAGVGGERSLTNSTWSYAPPNPAKPHANDAWGKPRPQNNKPWPHNNRQLPTWQASTWLLLKNLTAQIDGSTLKTLCVQHGPLQDFHLYLNQGIALARYSTREEAAKAQMALNNCVLSNTTIFAESPGESDVQMILQHLGSGGGGQWRGGGGGAKEWYPGVGGVVAPWTDPGRNTPSGPSLNSFLPPDLLSGESL